MAESGHERPRRRFWRTAGAAAVLLLLARGPAFAVSWIGVFPTLPTLPDMIPPGGGGGNTGSPPADAEPTIPPIFDWTEPGGEGPLPEGGPPDGAPTGDVSGAPEPATLIGGLIGIGAVGALGIWRRRSR